MTKAVNQLRHPSKAHVSAATAMALSVLLMCGGCELQRNSFMNPVDRGLLLFNQGNCRGALYNWLRIAKEGNVLAQNNMGLLWERGCPATAPEIEIPMPQSYAEAYNWYQLAAQNGLPLAVHNMAVYYEKGYGVPVDLGRAAALYALAARKGDERSRVALVRLGHPVPAADLVALAPAPSAGISWGQAITAALLTSAPTTPQTTYCSSQIVNDKVITNCQDYRR